VSRLRPTSLMNALMNSASSANLLGYASIFLSDVGPLD